MWAVRARGGVGTHWQPLNTLKTPRKCKPGVGSGRPGWGGVWAVRARGGVGTHWQPLNTLKTPRNASQVWVGVGWGVGGEGAGGCGHALAAFKYSQNT